MDLMIKMGYRKLELRCRSEDIYIDGKTASLVSQSCERYMMKGEVAGLIMTCLEVDLCARKRVSLFRRCVRQSRRL